MSEPITEPQEEPQWVPVRILGEEGQSILIEIEGPRRYYVPKGKIADGQIDVAPKALKKLTEYGVRWEAFLEEIVLSPEKLAATLRKRGIWTLDDLRERDRQLIRIATSIISKAVRQAANRAEQHKLPRRKKNAS